MNSALSGSSRNVLDRRSVGVILLLIVNVLWVLSAELTRFIFVDEDFKRPFFTAYVKTCLLTVYFVRYLSTADYTEQSFKVLENESDCESFDIGTDALNLDGFETVTSNSGLESESETEEVDRRIRFSSYREVRSLPASQAEDARRARLPYSPPILDFRCSLNISRHLKYTVFFFAPMWLICSFTYQTALLFTSVSSLNLISSSSSLFVLVLSICIPSNGSSFTFLKALLVAMNLCGVFAVSQFSSSLAGTVLAQLSAIAYALYLTLYTRFIEKSGEINMNLMFGSIGVMSVLIGSPLLFVLDSFEIECLYPLPNMEQLGSIVVSALFGTLLADYLWLVAAGLTDSLSASLSLTLSIPLSFLADSMFRHQAPSLVQLVAAVPITLSFIGAALLEQRASATHLVRRVTDDEHSRGLLDSDDAE